MQGFVDQLAGLEFVVAMWVFLAATVLHELEEWNINAFERRHFSGVPEYATTRSGRGVIAIISLAALLVGLLATLAGELTAAWIFLPVVAFMTTNACQHVYWSIRFRHYAPGVATALALILPLGAFLVVRALSAGLVEPWYVAALAGVSVAVWAQTVREGGEMSSSVRSAYRIASWVTDRLPG